MCYIHPTQLFQFQNDKNYLIILTLHDYFNFKMIKITYIDPARLFGAVRLF